MVQEAHTVSKNKLFADLLPDIRGMHALSEDEFAALIGVDPQIYTQYETGALQIPDDIRALISTDWLTTNVRKCLGNSPAYNAWMKRQSQDVLDLYYSSARPEKTGVSNKKKLKIRNERIIEMYHDGKTLEQIGQEMGLTFQRVQQIVKKGNGNGSN